LRVRGLANVQLHADLVMLASPRAQPSARRFSRRVNGKQQTVIEPMAERTRALANRSDQLCKSSGALLRYSRDLRKDAQRLLLQARDIRTGHFANRIAKPSSKGLTKRALARDSAGVS